MFIYQRVHTWDLQKFHQTTSASKDFMEFWGKDFNSDESIWVSQRFEKANQRTTRGESDVQKPLVLVMCERQNNERDIYKAVSRPQ
jgi:hypothetical protein